MKYTTKIILAVTLIVDGFVGLFILVDDVFALLLTALFSIAIGGAILATTFDSEETKKIK